MNRTQMRGFTLIELMIVVAIIAILAALAIGQYQDYIARSEFSEATFIADGMKSSIATYFNEAGRCPTNTTTGFLPAASYAGLYVNDEALGGTAPSCTITMTFKSAGVSQPLLGKSAVLTSTNAGGTLQWNCSSAGIAARYLPQVCR